MEKNYNSLFCDPSKTVFMIRVFFLHHPSVLNLDCILTWSFYFILSKDLYL